MAYKIPPQFDTYIRTRRDFIRWKSLIYHSKLSSVSSNLHLIKKLLLFRNSHNHLPHQPSPLFVVWSFATSKLWITLHFPYHHCSSKYRKYLHLTQPSLTIKSLVIRLVSLTPIHHGQLSNCWNLIHPYTHTLHRDTSNNWLMNEHIDLITLLINGLHRSLWSWAVGDNRVRD